MAGVAHPLEPLGPPAQGIGFTMVSRILGLGGAM